MFGALPWYGPARLVASCWLIWPATCTLPRPSPKPIPVSPESCDLAPSPAEYWPWSIARLPPLPEPFSTMLMTPAMASEPYCAEAPSRSTSTRSIAAIGIALMSTAEAPRPMLPLTLICAEVWRRLPLTSTSTWSGDSPRNCAGRMPLVPSVNAGRGKFSEGSTRDSAVASSEVPVDCSASLLMMSIGDCDSATVRSLTRVPVTMTVSRVLGVSVLDWARTGGAARAESTALANRDNGRFMETPADAEMADGAVAARCPPRGPDPQGSLLFFNNRAAAQHVSAFFYAFRF